MERPRPHVLVVDDDTRIRMLLKKFLQEQGFYVTTAAHAEEAREKLARFVFSLLVVDVMMPGETGIELTRAIRAQTDVPVVMLTAMGEPEDRITGLESGADDYLPKPFEPRELLLRINNILQRMQKQKEQKAQTGFGRYRFDATTLRLTRDGQEVILTSTEARLLALLVAHQGETISREQVASALHGVGERSVDVQIKRLRDKIEENPKQPAFLKTIRGQGYVFHAD